MKISMLMWLLGLSGSVCATELHKCVDADGSASYQSAPCPPAQRTAWVRVVAPDAVPAPPAATAGLQEPRHAPRLRPVAVRSRKPAVSRCESARRAADQTRDRLWNRLSFKQRSELDARVARACAR